MKKIVYPTLSRIVSISSCLFLSCFSAHAAVVKISSYSGGNSVLTPQEFNNAQNAAGVGGVIEFDQTLETWSNLTIYKWGITIKGINDSSGTQRKFTRKTGTIPTVSAPAHWDDLNSVPSSMIDNNAQYNAIFKVNTNNVTISNLNLAASDWPLLRANVASKDGEGSRVAKGIEYGIQVVSNGKNLKVESASITKVNVCIGFNTGLLPHGFQLKNSYLIGGRGAINSAESGSIGAWETSLDSKMTIDNVQVASYSNPSKNYQSARGFTFDYGNYLFPNGPWNGLGPIDFKWSTITRCTMGPLTTFGIDFNRAKFINIGDKSWNKNVIQIGNYRKDFVNCLHFEARAQSIYCKWNQFDIFRVGGENIGSASTVFSISGNQTKGYPSYIHLENNTHQGYPSALVTWELKNWYFQDETVSLGYAGQPAHSIWIYVSTNSDSATASHTLQGSATTNDFWYQPNQWARFWFKP